MKTEGLTGKLRLLSRTVPELPLTRNGTPYLDWNKGLPLHKFLSLISKSENANNIQTTALEENTNFPMKESIMTQYESSSERTASSLSNS